MSQRRVDIRSHALAAFALLALASGLGACSSLTDPPQPPAGGVTITLDYDQFVANVEPVLVAKGCDADGDCHGGGIRGTLALSPPTAKNVRFDYDQVVLQVSPTQRDSSHILTKPLAIAAGGAPHAVKPFADTTDPGYQAIRGWIQSGVVR